jgi:uncharacterized protein (TIGR02145 family)
MGNIARATAFTYQPGALTTTTYYRVVATFTGSGCNAATSTAIAKTVYPAFSAGSITTASGTTSPTTDPNVTIANSSLASGGNGVITYQWRRSGTSSETFSHNSSTYPINNSATNYSTAGTYYFTRYAHDGTCNTAWTASSGQYTLTVAVPNPPGAGTNTHTCGSQIWSEQVRIADCNKSSYTNSTTVPHCRSYTYNSIVYYYYNWAYVDTYGATMCPGPWRVPSVTDFENLVSCLGTSPTNGIYYPESSTWGGALSGYAGASIMNDMGINGSYWSATGNGVGNAYSMVFTTSYATVLGIGGKEFGHSLRCVRDAP